LVKRPQILRDSKPKEGRVFTDYGIYRDYISDWQREALCNCPKSVQVCKTSDQRVSWESEEIFIRMQDPGMLPKGSRVTVSCDQSLQGAAMFAKWIAKELWHSA